MVDRKTVAVLVRGDREVRRHQARNLLNATTVELAPAAVVEKVTAAPLGFAGPVGLDVAVYADLELGQGAPFSGGAQMPLTRIWCTWTCAVT